MGHILVEMMEQLTPLTEEEKRDIEQSFAIKTCQKGTYLIREGQLVQNAYYVIEGCFRVYQLQDGEEKTMAFHTENQSAVDFNSLSSQKPAKVNFVCAEDTTVAILNAEKEKALYKKHPRFESFCREGVEQMIGQNQEQIMELIALKPEQRYLKLQAERPGLINCVPQYQLASYLGIKPETLSRIRQRLATKANEH